MHKIMIIEDDLTISRIMEQTLKSWGYEVFCTENFNEVLKDFDTYGPQIILMDISLPFFSGYHWCSEIRKRSKVPIVFISSASDNLNMVMAMNLGADDFIAKPFDLNVFVAKIQAIIRRTYDYVGQVNVIASDNVVLSLTEATLSFEDHKLHLSKNDFKMLQILMENSGQVVSRSAIMTRLWESDSFIDDNTLTVNLTRLRKKLEEIGLVDWIVTTKGLGYSVRSRGNA